GRVVHRGRPRRHVAPRPQRRRQDHHRQGGAGAGAAHRPDRLRGPRHHRRPHARHRLPRHRLRAGGPGRVRGAHRRREPAAGGAARPDAPLRTGPRPVPGARQAGRAARRDPLRRPAADARHRPGAAQREPAAHRGRTHQGPGAARRGGGGRRGRPRRRGGAGAAGGAEPGAGAAGRGPGRRRGRRPGRAHRGGPGPAGRRRTHPGAARRVPDLRPRDPPAGRNRMSTVVLLVVTGLGLGALYFLIASGLSLIFGLMDVLNFAHGAFLTIGAYATWWASVYLPGAGGDGVGFLVAVAFGVAAGTLAATLVELGVIRPLYGRHREQILVTVGLSLAVPALVQAIWGADPLPFPRPELVSGTVTLLGAAIPTDRFLLIAVAALVLAGLLLFGTRTRYGLIVRAGVEDRAMVTALGIDVR